MAKKLFILLIFILFSKLFANEIFINENTQNININKIYFLKDKDYKLEDIKSKNFETYVKNPNEMFHFKFEARSTYWIKVKLKNEEKKQLQRNIYISYPDIKYINFYEYEKKQNKYKELEKSNHIKRVFNADFKLKELEEKTILIRVENHLRPNIFNIFILSQNKLYEKEHFISSIHNIYMGMMFLAIVYFVLSFFIMKRYIFIFYIIHIVCLVFFQLFVQGYPRVLSDDFYFLSKVQAYLAFISVFSYTLFTSYFLKSEDNKKYIRVLYIFLLAFFLSLVLYTFEVLSPAPLAFFVLLVYITINVISFKEYKKDNPFAFLILLSGIVLLLGVILHTCAIIFQIIPLYNILLYSVSYSNLIEVLIILFMFVTYFKKTYENKEKLFLEKLQLEQNFSKELKKEVEEKTLELQEINNSLNKRIKQAVEKSQEQERLIFFQSKLATMGETINIIAHQWRQPISVVSTHLSNMQFKIDYKKQYEEKELLDSIKEAKESLKYISSTISLFQSYLKPEQSSSNENFELKNTVNRAIKLFESILEKYNIKIKQELPNYTKINGDQDYFIQVLMVLLNNSKDAILEKNIEKPYIKIYAKESKDKIIFTFEDNAKGIDSKEDVFDPYISNKNSTGLGLFIARNIITKIFKGNINFKNSKDGAKFNIEFPIKIG